MNKIPEKIYLNIEPDSLTHLCWCEKQQNDSDIEYIRKTNNKIIFMDKVEVKDTTKRLIDLENKLKKCRNTIEHLDDCITDNNKIIDELEKWNEKLIENTLILLDCICSSDGCRDFEYCGRLRESKCSEILNSEELICKIKQKPIKEIIKDYSS